MREYFIDAGAFIAQSLKRDQYRRRALSITKRLQKEERPGVTSDVILSEVLTFLRRKSGHKVSLRFYEAVRESKYVSIIYTGRQEFTSAFKIFEQYQDKPFSFIDCLSFAIMKKRDIKQVFTFDKHFGQMGFEVLS